jgi:hypothetical protein
MRRTPPWRSVRATAVHPVILLQQMLCFGLECCLMYSLAWSVWYILHTRRFRQLTPLEFYSCRGTSQSQSPSACVLQVEEYISVETLRGWSEHELRTELARLRQQQRDLAQQGPVSWAFLIST